MTAIDLRDQTTLSANWWQGFIEGKDKLELSDKELIDEEIAALAEALKENKTVRIIDLSHNKFTAVGAKSFANALRINRYIALNPLTNLAINFSNNKIGVDGLLALCDAIYDTNRYLHCFNFSGDLGLTEEENYNLGKLPELQTLLLRTEEFTKTRHILNQGYPTSSHCNIQ